MYIYIYSLGKAQPGFLSPLLVVRWRGEEEWEGSVGDASIPRNLRKHSTSSKRLWLRETGINHYPAFSIGKLAGGIWASLTFSVQPGAAGIAQDGGWDLLRKHRCIKELVLYL